MTHVWSSIACFYETSLFHGMDWPAPDRMHTPLHRKGHDQSCRMLLKFLPESKYKMTCRHSTHSVLRFCITEGKICVYAFSLFCFWFPWESQLQLFCSLYSASRLCYCWCLEVVAGTNACLLNSLDGPFGVRTWLTRLYRTMNHSAVVRDCMSTTIVPV